MLTLHQIYIRSCLRWKDDRTHRPENKEELQKYMTGIVPPKARNCWPSIACRTTRISDRPEARYALSDLVGAVKAGLELHQPQPVDCWPVQLAGRFGLFVFPFAIVPVIRYIQNQEQHHARKHFGMNNEFLKKFTCPR